MKDLLFFRFAGWGKIFTSSSRGKMNNRLWRKKNERRILWQIFSLRSQWWIFVARLLWFESVSSSCCCRWHCRVGRRAKKCKVNNKVWAFHRLLVKFYAAENVTMSRKICRFFTLDFKQPTLLLREKKTWNLSSEFITISSIVWWN